MEPTSPKAVRSVDSAPAGEAAPPAKKRNPFVIFGGVVAVAGLIALGVFIATYGEESTDDAQVEADVIPISARVNALVLKVPIQENQRVKAGEVLFEFDQADYSARMKQAQAELATAKAQADAADAQARVTEASARGGLDTSKASLSGSALAVTGAEAQVASARAGLERARVDVKKAGLDLVRAKALKADNAIPQERLDNAQTAFDSAQAQLQQAQAALSEAEEAKHIAGARVAEAQGRVIQSSPIEATIAAAKASAALAHARVQSSEAQLELASLQLSYTRITAPSDGFVSKLAVHEGALVSPGMPVAELVPAQTYVLANFKETQVGKMKPGQRATVKIDAFPGHKLEGKVESLSGGTGARFSLIPPDNATGNFVKVVQRVPVRIAWSQPPGMDLRAGLSADVTVYLGKE